MAAGEADAVFLARALLRDPHWPLRAANALERTCGGRTSTPAPSPGTDAHFT